MSNPYKSPSTEGQRPAKPRVRPSVIVLIVLALLIPVGLALLMFANFSAQQADMAVPPSKAAPTGGSGTL